MFIIGTDVKKDVIIRNISAEWFKLRVNLDESKVETLHHIGLLDCEYSLDQGGNTDIFETLNSTKLQVWVNGAKEWYSINKNNSTRNINLLLEAHYIHSYTHNFHLDFRSFLGDSLTFYLIEVSPKYFI